MPASMTKDQFIRRARAAIALRNDFGDGYLAGLVGELLEVDLVDDAQVQAALTQHPAFAQGYRQARQPSVQDSATLLLAHALDSR